jgi:hypothetical protein
MADDKGRFNLEALRPLIDAAGLSHQELIARIARSIFETNASCDISCEKCSAGCITCSPGKSNPGSRFGQDVINPA